MSRLIPDWVIAHKEWCFTVLCATVGGAFALLKWIWPSRETLKSSHSNLAAIEGSDNAIVAVAYGATITGPVVAGSHNTQSVVINQINHSLHAPELPIRDRKPSSPTGNEIRQRQDSLLKGVPLVIQKDVLNQYLNGFLHVPVAWPIGLCDVYRSLSGEYLIVDARYGEESWGAYLRFNVRETDFPILNTLAKGHFGFVEGRILAITEHLIEIEVSKLMFE